MKNFPLIFTLLLVAVSNGLRAEPQSLNLTSSSAPPSVLPVSLRYEVDAARERAFDWLAAHQSEDGSWSDRQTPALTGLALWAFARSEHPQTQEVTEKAVRYLLSCRQNDGGIYLRQGSNEAGSLATYNTAIAMTALFATGRETLTPVVLKAREFVVRAQHFGSDAYYDGFGYDLRSGRRYANLLTAVHAAQAMHATSQMASAHTQGAGGDFNWADTVEFIVVANGNPTNVLDAAATNAPLEDTSFRTYGSMTYAGLLAMVYANVSPRDVRVRSALDWAMKHWSLEENPGMGQEGLYFFYYVLTRALDATGIDFIRLPDGTDLSWREALANKLLALQRTDTQGRGYWRNRDARFWEDDPVLATSYCLLALQLL